jgi:hypothetical protein
MGGFFLTIIRRVWPQFMAELSMPFRANRSMVGSFLRPGGTLGMTVAHYRINELDAADRIIDGYSVMCRSDAAALAMASKGADDHAAAVEVWEDTRHVARLDPVTPWHRLRNQWAGLPRPTQ